MKLLTAVNNTVSLDLLRTSNRGRVAVNGNECPSVFPVRYSVDGNTIVFQANSALLDEIDLAGSVTFQADGFDYERNCAWSVTACGSADGLRELGRLEIPVGFSAGEPDPWSGGNASRWLRIAPLRVDGVLAGEDILDIT